MHLDEIIGIICFFILVCSGLWCAFILPLWEATKQQRVLSRLKRDIKRQYRNAGQMHIIVNGVEKRVKNGKIKE